VIGVRTDGCGWRRESRYFRLLTSRPLAPILPAFALPTHSQKRSEVSTDTPFTCRHCDASVVVPGWYKRGLSWSAILLASVIAYELGLRDGAWLLFVGDRFCAYWRGSLDGYTAFMDYQTQFQRINIDEPEQHAQRRLAPNASEKCFSRWGHRC